MERHYYPKSALIILLLSTALPAVVLAQSRAYAKYGSSGETIGLFNLIKSPVACDRWQVITGTITGVRSQKRNDDLEFKFTLNVVGRFRNFAFSLGVDEMSRTDITDLVAKNRKVTVRACQRNPFWAA